ncbi:hypothetical protein FisN_7Hu024 [Fistulifera solaris]|uniref:CCHC-type domain-containing protein n=1 Tax=Fistulifera solaris TaxID=1519565 RepID=A0A1Z5K3C0_FISSO|nr:hypothetical protein FisN_7Hu024 [Fistulifera solaris]|eukprot:GAX20715.1 hypothetical protein FisN_7Hu024 [Fistulifera solaris]
MSLEAPKALSLRRAIQYLEERQPIWPYEQALLQPVLEILRTWFDLPSIINKRSLRHEIEESMVALYYLDCWREAANPEHFVVIDVCGGKGIFSLLLQYYARQHWPAQQLRRIVLLEKATSQQIDWSHLKALSDPPVTLLENCNLHDTDELVETFARFSSPLALSGIHLCKMLTPSLITLVNRLGEDRCPYVSVAPCCLPRVVTSKYLADEERILQVGRYESDQDRRERIKLHLLRKSRRNPVKTGCYHCQGIGHEVSKCPLLSSAMLRQRDVEIWGPCWKCGEVGHFRENCPKKNAPLTVKFLEMQTVSVAGVVDSPHPLSVYCERLLPAFHNRTMKVIETGLENRGHSLTNWNSQRKSLFIVPVP